MNLGPVSSPLNVITLIELNKNDNTKRIKYKNNKIYLYRIKNNVTNVILHHWSTVIKF